jgi:hypothetical protein|tara:strand:+ start:27237 stop:27950 length:714 start_codon:yes stop_codon:yes gene_type:complete
MRAYLIILFISLSWSMPDINRFSKVIKYEYSAYIDLLNIKIGEASLSVEKTDNIGGQDVYHLNFSVKTSKLGDRIYKIRNKIDVWIDKENLNVVRQEKSIRELRKKKKSITSIQGELANTNGKKYIINENTFDPYSLLLILPEFEIPIETSKKFNIVDAGKVKEIELTNEGVNKIRTPYGTFLAYTLTPSKNDDAVLKNKGDMEISYASINGNLVPIQILIKLGQGVISLRLKKVRE